MVITKTIQQAVATGAIVLSDNYIFSFPNRLPLKLKSVLFRTTLTEVAPVLVRSVTEGQILFGNFDVATTPQILLPSLTNVNVSGFTDVTLGNTISLPPTFEQKIFFDDNFILPQTIAYYLGVRIGFPAVVAVGGANILFNFIFEVDELKQ
jgi:hypothetical protein